MEQIQYTVFPNMQHINKAFSSCQDGSYLRHVSDGLRSSCPQHHQTHGNASGLTNNRIILAEIVLQQAINIWRKEIKKELKEREREKERQTDRQTDRQTHTHTERDRQTDRDKERKKQADSPWSAVPIAARPSPKHPP